ncbi:MAG: L-dopachrome tautomerase-related protein [Calditrichota bacterium]
MKIILTLTIATMLFACGGNTDETSKADNTSSTVNPPIGTLEVVAEMDINPGNVAVSKEGRIFTSIHPLRSKKLQLVEVTGKTNYAAFPDMTIQSTAETKSDDKLDTPLGVIFDDINRLWVIDAGLNLGKTRLFAYDIDKRTELMRFDIPQELAPKTSFVQDLAIDAENGLAYLADFGNPGIIVVDINNKTFRKITHLPSMASEDIDMIIDEEVQYFMGEPARVGLNPITLSADNETIYYGAMNGTKWYQLPAAPIRTGESDEAIITQITIAGPKPLSDGVATDKLGNHYFTNIQNSSIDVLSADGNLSTLKQDALMDWPDNVRIHEDWLYVAVNQLHKSPAFTGDKDLAEKPFRILRIRFQ